MDPFSILSPMMGQMSQDTKDIFNVGHGLTMLNIGMKRENSMYNRQRSDAIHDWNMQNEYNHPSAVMARLRKAGLNPNLVYGTGAQAQSVSPPRSSSYQSAHMFQPQLSRSSIGNVISEMYDLEIKEAQVDNLRAQNTQILENTKLLKAKTGTELLVQGQKETDIEFQKRRLDYFNDVYDTSLEGATLKNKQMKENIDFTHDANIRAWQTQKISLEQAVANVLKTQAEVYMMPLKAEELSVVIENLKKSGEINDFEILLNKSGSSKHDALWQRFISRVLSDLPKWNKKLY